MHGEPTVIEKPQPTKVIAEVAAGRLLPELLAPAGDWDCARAAVENGADAIYFGLDKFNARMRAKNFTESDLPRLMEFLHRRGVKGYLTFNTLVFENELADAEAYLRTTIAAGVDAAIVQDVGVCRLIRQLSPDFPIHVSTQMTITSAAGVEFARELGCNLVVLARECSLKEIEKIAAEIKSRGPEGAGIGGLPGFPLEVFVHGALCVAYSGQCLTSEALGGRSANRGECAQACRMPYDLIANGKSVPLGDKKYLLSPQDLAGLELIPELAKVGVSSLKIEGRLKSPEYVASITRVYRQALDGLQRTSGGTEQADPQHARYEMEMAFSRGLYTGWFRGNNNQELVHARFGKKRGVYLGEVIRIERGRVHLQLHAPLKRGDGVVFDSGNPQEEEQGGRIYDVQIARATSSARRPNQDEKAGSEWATLAFGDDDIDWTRVQPGNKLWKTNDPDLDRRLRQTFQGTAPRFHRSVSMQVHGLAGKPLSLIAKDQLGHIAKVDSEIPLEQAQNQPLTTERLREQLGRLGGTPFELGEMQNLLEGQVMLPVSELNRLRREAAQQLETLRARPPRWQLVEPRSEIPPNRSGGRAATQTSELVVLVRNLRQLDAAIQARVSTIYCDFEDPKKYRAGVRIFRDTVGESKDRSIFVAPPRIFKMGEEWTLNQVRSSEADGYLARNYDHLRFFEKERRVGDFSLNIANHFAADYFREKFKLERVTASYDLNWIQLEALLCAGNAQDLEVTIHQHIPMFHMEHCVFCAFLSKGADYRDCGRPCDTHDLKLKDRVGAEHPVKADAGCRNTVFNSMAQTGADYVTQMISLGVRYFRVEFLNETPETVTRTIDKYRELLRGEITGQQVWRELKLLNQLGVTRGQMAS